MRVLTVVGNRPQFVKAAAVSAVLRREHEEVLVHTGQHYDPELSDVFFAELGLPRPDVRLEAGRGSNTAQTARMLGALEPLLGQEEPDVVLVYGDTNSTLAGGLAAAQAGRAVVHVEAGLRAFDRAMPEELNRVLVDHLAALLLCPTSEAVANLEREGVGGEVELVGDVMADVAAALAPRVRERRDVPAGLGLRPGAYLLVTAHRAGTVDDPQRLAAFVALLEGLEAPAVLPLHPRTAARLQAAGLRGRVDSIAGLRTTAPMGPIEFAALLHHARAVLTDSGGVQKEAYLAGVACLTLRDRTEWTETVAAGWNVLVDLDPAAVARALQAGVAAERPALYGDGRAAERVVAALERLVGAGGDRPAPNLPE